MRAPQAFVIWPASTTKLTHGQRRGFHLSQTSYCPLCPFCVHCVLAHVCPSRPFSAADADRALPPASIAVNDNNYSDLLELAQRRGGFDRDWRGGRDRDWDRRDHRDRDWDRRGRGRGGRDWDRDDRFPGRGGRDWDRDDRRFPGRGGRFPGRFPGRGPFDRDILSSDMDDLELMDEADADSQMQLQPNDIDELSAVADSDLDSAFTTQQYAAAAPVDATTDFSAS